MEQKNTVEITKKDGTVVTGNVLYAFEANGDNFVLYSIQDEFFGAKIMDDGSLKTVENDEWKLLEKIFKKYFEEGANDNI